MSGRRAFLKNSLLPVGAICLPSILTAAQPPLAGSGISPLSLKLKTITRNTTWTLVNEIKVQFKTFHCQGMVKRGNDLWVSSVEKGAGHLFKIDGNGKLLADIAVGEGVMYHPSGIDFDGRHIWVAAAEYRPDSQSIIYRFDPELLQLEEVFRWQDHVGGLARNPDSNILHGITWGSRRFYAWKLDKKEQLRAPYPLPADLATLNPAFYIDYQDNQYLGGQEMLYTGLTTYKTPQGAKFSLGGLEIIDLDKRLPVHQVPIQLWSPVSGAPMTQNPSFFELTGENKIRAHFIPDDDDSTIYVYEV